MLRFPLLVFASCLAPLAGALVAQQISLAQQITQPVYRVADKQPMGDAAAPHADPAVQPAAAITGQPAGLEGSPFDLAQRPGEHPLMPVLRLARQGLVEMDQNIRGYSAMLTKTERIGGKAEGPQQIAVRVRHKPFSVHMKFIQPHAGREVLYNELRNDGKLVALGAGWKRRVGKIKLDPNGSMAMNGQRYPITMTGIYNLTEELIKVAEQDVKYGECTVRYSTKHQIDGRPTTMIEARHPVPRRNFRFNIARIFIDNEMRVPVAYSAYSWPTKKGGQPILEEEYIYTNVKLNPGFTDADFDETNPALFQ
ncbi:MAG: DUF1571 domain-containing protein [Planctomycetota bacterium]